MLKAILALRNKKNWSKPSYAQCGEDLIVKFIFDQLGIYKPSYIDVGAHHPFFLSNTALFYALGSKGINIEPDPFFFGQFKKNRQRDINLNLGVGEKGGTADFYIISDPKLNTFSKREAENYNNEGNFKIKDVLKIPVNTLEEIISKYSSSKFPDFLNVDAEGIDELIIKSIDFEKNAPIVICIETISFSTTGEGIKNQSIIDFIITKGFFLYADTYINSIFVKSSAWATLKS
ncbi:FkbM family methyltransferase [Pedobacter aquatilis]|uniref:FkbM family methyltransferase n=1 Tax=Pedobacter aquatilis TaxID=351343 RepID=UPI00292E1103|nr:FkbM family methyltransferase [Pedobacter aquatilis]